MFKKTFREPFLYTALCARARKRTGTLLFPVVPGIKASNSRTFGSKASSRNFSSKLFRSPLRWPLAVLAFASIGYFSYKIFLPNIAGFPQYSRDHIRKALWARDKESDIPKAISHFEKAIEHMSLNFSEPMAWHLVGTIVELVELLISIGKFPEAIQYYNKAVEVLFEGGFDFPENIKENSKKLSLKIKNKLVTIKLELAHLYHRINDLLSEKKSLDDALLLIFNEARTTDFDTDSPSPFHQGKVVLPHWLSAEEFVFALGQAADFYREHNPEYAVPLYHIAIRYCKGLETRSILFCNLGSTYFSLGQYSYAARFLREGINSLPGENDIQEPFVSVKASLLFNLALVYEAQSDFERSLQIFKQLWALRKKFSDHITPENWMLVKNKVLE